MGGISVIYQIVSLSRLKANVILSDCLKPPNSGLKVRGTFYLNKRGPSNWNSESMFLTDDHGERVKACVNYRSPSDADNMSY